MSNNSKPRNNITGKFTKTSNPRSERMYLTIYEKDLIDRLRRSKIKPTAAITYLNRFFNVKSSIIIRRKKSSD